MNVDHLIQPDSVQGLTPWPVVAFSTLRLWDTGTLWGAMNPSKGTYSWTYIDSYLSMAQTHNVNLLYTFGGVPLWAIPTNIVISSFSRAGNVVTVTTTSPHGLHYTPVLDATSQSQITISGASDSSFNGTFYITGTPSTTTVTFAQTGSNGTATGGSLSAVCSGGYTGRNSCAEAPLNISDWDNFVTAFINHVGPGKIKYFEAWNEANIGGTWTGDTQTLLTMTQHMRTIIKAVDPNAIIFSPSVTVNFPTASECSSDSRCGSAWLNNWCVLGGKNYIDGVAFHGYPGFGEAPEQIQGQIALQRAAMSANGISSLPLWDTEASWGQNPQLPNETDQASWLARHFLLEQSSGIAKSVWYAYDSSGDTWGSLWTPSGLIPEGNAYVTITNWLVGSTLTSPCANVSGNVWSCSYTNAGVAEKIIWSTSGTVSYTVGTTFGHQNDLLTNTTTPVVGGVISVGELPILVKP
jgi:hypothetical protein